MAVSDPAVPFWPAALSPRDVTDPDLIASLMSGPAPLGSVPQVVMSDVGRWQIQFIGIPVHSQPGGPDLIGLYRSLFIGRLKQGLAVKIPFRDRHRGPAARAGLPVSITATYGDGATFSDASLFGQGSPDCQLAADAAAEATSITVDVFTPQAALTAGDFFTLGDRAHVVTGIAADDTVANRWRWNFLPTLREASAAGDAIETRNPYCRMVLHPKDRNTSLQLEMAIVGRQSLTFVEDNWS